MKRIFYLIALSVLALSACTQNISVEMPTEEVKQYSMAEFDLKLTAEWTNPYLQEDVALDMLVNAPSGKTLVVPCYYVSGESGSESLWRARFMPQETGKYKARFVMKKDGENLFDSAPVKFDAVEGEGKGILHVNDNWTLKFDNGELFRGIGECLCWESRDNDDSKYFKDLHEQKRFNYDYMIPMLAENGGNFTRVWMCSWNMPIMHNHPRNNSRYTASDEYYNPSACDRLEHLLKIAEENGIYIMLTLTTHADRLDPNDPGRFFTDADAISKYKNRMRYMIARWGWSPAIGMWEFFNEIDNVQFRNHDNPIPAADIVNWHDIMSKYVKATDPYGHITTTSISHRDLEGLNSLECMDINQKHIYRNTDAIPGTITRYEEEFGKPYVIGEFGYEWDWSKNFNDFAEEMDTDFRRGLWYGIFSPTPVTPMSWWWEFFDMRGIAPYFKSVREISDKMLADSEGKFEQLDIKCEGARPFAVKCGKNIYVYLFNGNKKASAAELEITAAGDYDVQSFNPSARTYAQAGTVSGTENLKLAIAPVAPQGEALYILNAK